MLGAEIVFFVFKFGLWVFDGAAEVWFLCLFGVQLNVVVVEVDEGGFLVGGEEVVFTIVVGTLERLY